MAKITSETLDQFLNGVNKGIVVGYFGPASVSNRLPSKYVIYEAEKDLEYILKQPIPADGVDPKSSRRLEIYLDIIRLLKDIPEEVFLANKNLTHALHIYAAMYSNGFDLIKSGNVGYAFASKYALISERTGLEDRIASGEGNGSTRKLIELIDKYIELLGVDYITIDPKPK